MKTRKKRSIIWSLSKAGFQELVNNCTSLADILRKLDMHAGAGNYKTLHRRIKEDGIIIDHIIEQTNNNKTKVAIFINTKSLDEILVKNSTYNHGNNIKRRLFEANLLINQCYECGQLPEWNNKPLTLQLDHINGDHYDNRLENLRILCPHCHTQTDTYNGRHNKIKYKCIDCKAKISKNHARCLKCNKIYRRESTTEIGVKIKWPTDENLLSMLRNSNFVQVGKQLGVTDNAIRKRLKKRNLLHLV